MASHTVVLTDLTKERKSVDALLIEVSCAELRIEALEPFRIGDSVRVDIRTVTVLPTSCIVPGFATGSRSAQS
jgi:hypothetical protein